MVRMKNHAGKKGLSATIPYKRDGFTLIELLVVISIIALLMAILMPALRRVRAQARAAVCLSQMNQWGLIFAIYLEDSDGLFFSHWGGWDSWTEPMYKYYGEGRGAYYYDEVKIALCPSARKKGGPLNEAGAKDKAWGPWGRGAGGWTPKNHKSYGLYSSYGINGYIYRVPPNQGPTYIHDLPSEWFWKGLNESNLSNIPIFLDSMWNDSWVQESDNPPEYDGEISFFPQMRRFCIDRHNGYVNAAFLDFSVRRIGLKQLWTLKWHRKFDTNGIWTSSYEPPPVWPDWMNNLRNY